MSAWAFFGHNFRLPEPPPVNFFGADRNIYFSQHHKKSSCPSLSWPWNFYMVEYCESFKMVFSKILDFLRWLKICSIASMEFHKLLVMTDKVKTVIGYYFLNLDSKSRGQHRRYLEGECWYKFVTRTHNNLRIIIYLYPSPTLKSRIRDCKVVWTEFIELCSQQIDIVAYVNRTFPGMDKSDQAPF